MFFGESKKFEGYFRPFLKDIGVDLDKLILSLAEEVTKNKFKKETKQCLTTLIVLLACDSYLDLSSKKIFADDEFEFVIQKYKDQRFNPFNKISANDLRLSFMNMKSTINSLISNKDLLDNQLARFIFVGAFIDVLTQQSRLSVKGKDDITYMFTVGRNTVEQVFMDDIVGEIGRQLVENEVLGKPATNHYFHNDYCKYMMGKIEQLISENIFANLKENQSKRAKRAY